MLDLTPAPYSWATCLCVCLIHLGMLSCIHQRTPPFTPSRLALAIVAVKPASMTPPASAPTAANPSKHPAELPRPPPPSHKTLPKAKAVQTTATAALPAKIDAPLAPALATSATIAATTGPPAHTSASTAASAPPNTSNLTQPRIQGIATRIRSPLKGRVSVTVLISPQNQPLSITTTGTEPQLYAQARRLAEGGRYRTALRDGLPIEASITFDILFN